MSDDNHHAELRDIVKKLPTDYTDYGGTIERWADIEAAYPDCSCGCRWAIPLLEVALAEHDDHFGESTDPNHWSCQARLALRGPVLVTGLEAHECFARYRDLFGEIAHDYVAGAYDDQKRLRANVWYRAYRELTA